MIGRRDAPDPASLSQPTGRRMTDLSAPSTTASAPPHAGTLLGLLKALAVWGPGILVMLADSDAGNVITAAQAGAQWGYRLLPLLLLLIPALYLVQDLAVRLGIHTGLGQGELIRRYFGRGWAWLSLANLAVAVTGTLITEFTGIAGIGEMFGVPRAVSLGLATLALLAVSATRSYRRIERAALIIGLFELAFFGVAWSAHPDAGVVLHQVLDQPWHDHGYLYLVAALIGAAFNPWMVFYQQRAVSEKGLSAQDYASEKWDTALGAVLTQCLTAAVLVAAAAALGGSGGIDSVARISDALVPILGTAVARPVFAAGVLGAALVAAIVSSLSLAWTLVELSARRASAWFHILYAGCIVAAACLVGFSGDLVELSIAAQVLNAFLLPLVLGFLLILARRALPAGLRPRGGAFVMTVAALAAICVVGLVGGLSGLLPLK